MVLILGSSGAAWAQYGPPPPRPYYAPAPGIHRMGLVIGGAIGPGAFAFSDCSGNDCSIGALALQLEIGGMVAPNVAVLFDWTGLLHPTGDANGTVVSSNLIDVAVRGFLSRIFWLEGGIGIGYVTVSDAYYYDTSDFGLGLMAAAGVEVLQTYNFAIDLSLRVHVAHIYENPSTNVSNLAFLIGFHWY